MKPDSMHTKGKWWIEKAHSYQNLYSIYNEDNLLVADNLSKANAECICKAVNNNKRMIKLIEQFQVIIKSNQRVDRNSILALQITNLLQEIEETEQ